MSQASARLVLGVLALFVGLSACGTGNQDGGAPTGFVSSAIVLTAPADAHASGRVGAASFTAAGDRNSVLMCPIASDAYFNLILDDETGVLLARAWSVGGVDFLLVGAIDANGSFTLYRFHDDTADGVVDQATQTTLFSTSPEPGYITDIANFGNAWYFLDRRTQDVRVALDANADGFPDALRPQPFAMSSTYPSLLDVHHIYAYAEGVLLGSTGPMTRLETRILPHHAYEDSDDDLVADSDTAIAEEHPTPRLRGHLYHGQSQVQVRLDGAPPRVIEVWRLDAQTHAGEVLLGAIQPSSDAWTSIPLSMVLDQDEVIGVGFAGAGTKQRVLYVGPAYPEILDHDVAEIVIGETPTVTLTGQNFSATMALELETADGTTHSLAVTYVDAQNISFDVPPLTVDDTGTATLVPTGIGQGPDDPAYGYPVSICTAEDLDDG